MLAPGHSHAQLLQKQLWCFSQGSSSTRIAGGWHFHLVLAACPHLALGTGCAFHPPHGVSPLEMEAGFSCAPTMHLSILGQDRTPGWVQYPSPSHLAEGTECVVCGKTGELQQAQLWLVEISQSPTPWTAAWGQEEGDVAGDRWESWDRAHCPHSAVAGAPCFAARLVGTEVWFPSLSALFLILARPWGC